MQGGGLGEQRVLLDVAGLARHHDHRAGRLAHEAPGDAADHDGVQRTVAARADEQEVELLRLLGQGLRGVTDGEECLGPGLVIDLRDRGVELLARALCSESL